MFKLINVIVFVQICTRFELDACNMFQNSRVRGNKILGKMRNA